MDNEQRDNIDGPGGTYFINQFIYIECFRYISTYVLGLVCMPAAI